MGVARESMHGTLLSPNCEIEGLDCRVWLPGIATPYTGDDNLYRLSQMAVPINLLIGMQENFLIIALCTICRTDVMFCNL